VVKQVPQILPSGHRARILAFERPHRSWEGAYRLDPGATLRKRGDHASDAIMLHLDDIMYIIGVTYQR
jgi:hypothetical protein